MKIVLKRATLIFLLGGITLVLGFTAIKSESKFKAVHINWVWQMLQNDELVPIRQSIDIFYSKEYLIARTRQRNVNTDTRLKPGTNDILNEKITIDSTYVYLISKKGERYGLTFFDTTSMVPNKHYKMDVDSFIKATLIPPNFFYKLRSKSKDSISIVKDEKKGTLLEKYLYKRREIQEPDSMYFYFRKQPMEFSFPVKDGPIDYIYLYKTRAICNASKKGQFPNVNVDVHKYEHHFEITEIDVPEIEIKSKIDQFKIVRANRKELSIGF
jgi:hypothetical protein